MTVDASIGGENDKFPAGMRVLAVDDDPTCLKLLEALLRKCEYQVTITSQAKMALKMLREDKDRFDLVISDVHMPDMDGFKLLELVGLEMDLPVIMLSGNSDTKLVMKGISHGACDYLVKPVRIEELRNIWQHVIRRKKLDSKSKLMSQDRNQKGNGDGNEALALPGNADQNGKFNRKRKDEEEEGEEHEHDDEDPATQKKPRVVWSIELHRKFVAAVNHLGMEKAVPKRILDLMNVEGLTRENVASHLQKYRLYLKRISSVASQQANIAAAFGGKDSSYMRIGSLHGVDDLSTLAGHGRLSNSSLSSYTPGTMLGRLNCSSGLNLRNLSPSFVPPSHAKNLGNSMNSFGKFQQVIPFANQNASIFQGIPSSLELDLFQHSTMSIEDLNLIDDSKIYSSTSTFADTRVAVGCSSNVLTSASGNPLILQGNSYQSQAAGAYGTLSSLKSASVDPNSSNVGFNDPNFSDHDRCNENWHSAIQSLKCTSNSLQLTEPINHDHLRPNVMRDNNSPTAHYIQNYPPINSVLTSLEDSRREVQCQEGLVGDVIRNFNQAQNCRWGEQHKQDYACNSNGTYRNFNSLAPANGLVSPLCQSIDQLNGICNKKMDLSLVDQSSFRALGLMLHSEVESSSLSSKVRSHEDYPSEQTKLQGGFVPNSYDSLDDLMNAVVKTEQDGKGLMDGGFGYDSYDFGSCI